MAFDIERWSSTNAQAVLELPTYYIGRFEVTVAQMRSFVQATGYPIDGQALGGAPGHPATFISWPDALAYSRWLDEILRTSPDTPEALSTLLEDGGQVTLPTEAEWEKPHEVATDGSIHGVVSPGLIEQPTKQEAPQLLVATSVRSVRLGSLIWQEMCGNGPEAHISPTPMILLMTLRTWKTSLSGS